MAISMRRTSTGSSWSDLTLVVGGLAVASAIELAILRTFTRTAIHIPALNALQEPYEVLSKGGRYAYFVAVALMLPAMAMLALQFGRRGFAALFGVLLFAAVAAGAAAGVGGRLILDWATLTAIVVLAGGLAIQSPRRAAALPLASFGLAFAMSGAYSAAPDFAEAGANVEFPGWLLDGAEISGLAFALTAPLIASGRGDRAARWTGLAIGGLALLVFLGNGSTSRFLLLWNVGLSGILPGFLYAAAAGTLSYTVVALARSGRGLEAAGLGLLITGGIGLHSTYQSGLVVAGLAALWAGTLAAAQAGEGAEARAENPDAEPQQSPASFAATS